jgi:hypothetical protein
MLSIHVYCHLVCARMATTLRHRLAYTTVSLAFLRDVLLAIRAHNVLLVKLLRQRARAHFVLARAVITMMACLSNAKVKYNNI